MKKTLQLSWSTLRKFTLVFMMVILSSCVGPSNSVCEFDAIFNFGDSNSDTGGYNAAFPAQGSPFGMTYFKKPVGRASDGRLIVDFLAEALGLPHLSPYLQSIGSDYRHGANFASSASTVLEPTTSFYLSGLSPFALDIQLRQMKHFKARVAEFHDHEGRKLLEGCSSGNILPSPDVFDNSIYTFYSGQNDFISKLASSGINGVRAYIPQIVTQIDAAIKEVYALGGRTFLVFNLAPLGCYPAYLVELPHGSSDVDKYGCVVTYNNAVDYYNELLKETLSKSRQTLKNSSLVYVDSHSALLDLVHNSSSHGLKFGSRACCGYGGGVYNFNPKILCGNLAASVCEDPQNYVSWDGFHLTEAANKLVTLAILNGSLFDPPFPLHKHCELNPIY